MLNIVYISLFASLLYGLMIFVMNFKGSDKKANFTYSIQRASVFFVVFFIVMFVWETFFK